MDNSFKDKTPGQLADELLKMTALYGQLSDELSGIYTRKNIDWEMLRDTVKSDRQADQKWFRTDLGAKEQVIEMRMKKIQRHMSTIKTYLQVKENEARSLY